MGFSNLPRTSLDDSSLLVDRRTRSSSPSKNRHSLPPAFFDMRLPHLPMASQDDLRSATSSSSSSNISHEHLKQLSQSPLSKRLHVNTVNESSKYVIPIPFTLNLPPKLSQKNIQMELAKEQEKEKARSLSPVRHSSPARSNRNSNHSSPTRSKSPHKRTQLVYTGSGYEKLESSSDEELTEEQLNKRIAFSRRPAPPPVLTNKTSKIAFQNNLLPDELSIIEEASNSGASSRNSSVKSKADEKSLPPPPIEKDHSTKPNVPVPINPKPAYTNVRIVPNKNLVKPISTSNTDRPTVIKSMPSTPSIPKTITALNLRALHDPSSPTRNAELRIQKRTFSDESHVSSISSFSSIGDIMSFNRMPIQYKNSESSPVVLRRVGDDKQNRDVSISSTTSRDSEGSEASWDSLQSSIELKRQETNHTLAPPKRNAFQNTSKEDDEWEDDNEIEDSVSEDNTDSYELSGENVNIGKFNTDRISSASITQDDSEEEEEDSSEESVENVSKIIEDTQPLRISRAPTLDVLQEAPKLKSYIPSPDDDAETEYDYGADDVASISTAKYSEITCAASPKNKQATPDRDNVGAGRRFSFPNNEKNVTNSEEIRKKYLSGDSLKSSKSRMSYLSRETGQIEIPDLDDEDVLDTYSASVAHSAYNGTRFEDIPSEVSSSAPGFDEDVSQLEPIGVPTKAAQNVVKEHFKAMHNDDDSDTDIESTKFSLYALRHKAKSSPCLAPDKNKELPSIENSATMANISQHLTFQPVSRSPVRHQRHKSMFNIDFDMNDFAAETTKTAAHKRAKSTDLSNLSTPKQTTANNDVLSPEVLDIVIAEPPSQVRYAVDFKEAETNQDFDYGHSTFNHIYRSKTVNAVDDIADQMKHLDVNRYRYPHWNDKIQRKDLEEASYSSKSSFQSGNSAKPSTMTSESDTESVVIDLTKENYDICMVNRSNSTHSYKSVTEKTKDGREVEVVLVDEDEEDLMSLYSKYRNDSWLFRTHSTTSSTSSTSSRASDGSTQSYDSNTASEAHISVKHRPDLISRYNTTNTLRVPGNLVADLDRKRSNLSDASSNLSTNYNSRRIQPPKVTSKSPTKRTAILHKPDLRPTYTISNKRHTVPNLDSNYFDYTSGDKYDFKSFMQEQSTDKTAF